jgi:diguanylate cyclase (GGDEF)-like protein
VEVELKARADILAARNEVLSALLQAVPDLSMADDTDDIIQTVCDAAVHACPHIMLAWAWYGDPRTTVIEPMLFAGPATAYARNLRIEKNFLTLRGPAFKALLAQTGEAMTISRTSLFGPWRHASQHHRLACVFGFPLRVPDDGKRGLLMLYADQADYTARMGVEPFKALAKVAERALIQSDVRLRLRSQATTDPLTGLHNRRFVNAGLARLHERHAKLGAGFAVLLIDIDHFKRINDKFGHHRGDAVLVTMGALLRQYLRSSDIIGRWGGEEFICVIADATRNEMTTMAERIRREVADTRLENGNITLQWTVSIGVALSDTADTVADTLGAADAALYEAKAAGRDRVIMTKGLRRLAESTSACG